MPLEIPALREPREPEPLSSMEPEGARRFHFTYPTTEPVPAQAVPSSGPPVYYPFQGIDASAAGVAKIRFAYGTVGNASPTFGGNPINPVSDEATVSNGDKVYLDATVDAAGVVTALIATRAASVPADTTTHKYRLLFTVVVSLGAVTSIGQSVTTNLSLFICNGNAIWERA